MSTHLESRSPSVPTKRDFPKINSFFDALELIAERMEKLVWKAKLLLFGTGFLLFLIYELALFGKHLLKMWGHS
jgi:hypothetical protein